MSFKLSTTVMHDIYARDGYDLDLAARSQCVDRVIQSALKYLDN